MAKYLEGIEVAGDRVLPEELQAMRRLWAAKLLRHVKDYAQGAKAAYALSAVKRAGTGFNRSTLMQEAEAWFNDKSEAPASFIWVCWVLELDPTTIRNKSTRNWRTHLALGE